MISTDVPTATTAIAIISVAITVDGLDPPDVVVHAALHYVHGHRRLTPRRTELVHILHLDVNRLTATQVITTNDDGGCRRQCSQTSLSGSHTHTHTHTHNRLTAFCPGLPGQAGTRRNTHPLTPILIIGHPLSTSSIHYDP